MPYAKAGPDANPELANVFLVDIEGVALGSFQKCKVSDFEWNTSDNREGPDDLTKLPSASTKKSWTIMLTKNQAVGGDADIQEFFDWWEGGDTDRRTGSVIHLDRTGTETHRYNFELAFCSKIEVPEWDAEADDSKLPTVVTIAARRVVRQSAG